MISQNSHSSQFGIYYHRLILALHYRHESTAKRSIANDGLTYVSAVRLNTISPFRFGQIELWQINANIFFHYITLCFSLSLPELLVCCCTVKHLEMCSFLFDCFFLFFISSLENIVPYFVFARYHCTVTHKFNNVCFCFFRLFSPCSIPLIP